MKFPVFEANDIFYTILPDSMKNSIELHLPWLKEIRHICTAGEPFYSFYGKTCVIIHDCNEGEFDQDIQTIFEKGYMNNFTQFDCKSVKDPTEIDPTFNLRIKSGTKFENIITSFFKTRQGMEKRIHLVFNKLLEHISEEELSEEDEGEFSDLSEDK